MTSLFFGASFIIVMLSLVAFFAGVETGLFSVSRAKIRTLSEKGDQRAQIILRLLEKPEYFIGTALLGINLAHVTLAVVTARWFDLLFDDHGKAVFFTAILVTPTVLFVGEIIPKTIFRLRPHAATLIFARSFNLFYTAMLPITAAVLKIAHWIVPASQKNIEADEEMRREEIRWLVREGEKSGAVELDEKEMIESAFELVESDVKEAMVPRVSMSAIAAGLSHEEMVSQAVADGYTRYPVYSETPDEILGILHVADLLGSEKFDPAMLTKPFYISEFTKIDEALELIRRSGSHIAIVVDEYGGTAGLVTIEDLLEELVGEIDDEFDDLDPRVTRISDYRWSVDARTDIEEAEEKTGLSFTRDGLEAETVGGMLTEHIGRIPQAGERFRMGEIVFEVSASDERRIIRVEIFMGK